MSNDSTDATLTIQGFTPYAQVPRWVLRTGDRLSHGAVRLYGVIMTYASNDERTAFPGRERLAEDMGVKVRSVSTYIKELEDFGALTVTRRRNRRTGNFYSNHYTLIFTEPGAEYCTPPDAVDDPVTRPTVVTRPTPSSTPDESDHGCTSGLRPDARGPGNLTGAQRGDLRHALRAVGRARAAGSKWNDPDAQDAWWSFTALLEEHVGSEVYEDHFADLLENGKWTVSAEVAGPYAAGVELNKILNTGLAR